jgi:PmbA protein
MTDILNYCSSSLAKANVDKFQCSLTKSNLYEMNMEGNDFSLIRTTIDNKLNITIIKDKRKADISLNRIDEKSIDEAIDSVIELSGTSQQDPDYDISPKQEAQQFVSGPDKPDTERMYSLLKEFIKKVSTVYPEVLLSESVFSHNHSITHFMNSNSVDFTTSKGIYRFYSLFSSKDTDKTSSFNYSGFSLKNLSGELLEHGSLNNLLRQSIEHLRAQTMQGKFVGDVIITPDCLDDLLYSYIATYLGDRALITGLSLFKDKLGQMIAHPKLTLHSKPLSREVDDGYFVTPDGFAAEDITIIDKGSLKSFMLSLYGANKTKLERAKNAGGNFIIEPGDKSFDEMVASVKKGILFARYSGGMPSANGDFSGIAKNSYYIEDGKIKYPVSEVMVSGNLTDLFKNIIEISKERINFGTSIYPYIQTSGVTISGK